MDIAEVRAKFPQYNDMSDAELATALHRKYYSDIPPEEFAAKIGLAPKPAEPAKPQRSTAESLVRTFVGLPARDLVQGAMSIPNTIGDGVNTAINYGIRGVNSMLPRNLSSLITGKHGIPELGMPSQALPRILTQAGLPNPETGPEQFTSAVNQAVFGFAPMLKGAQLATGAKEIPFVKSMLTKPAAELSAVATGAGASDITKQMGGGTTAQLIAGALTPMGISAASNVVGRVAGGANELRRPLTRGGAEQIAADVIGRTTDNKALALRNLAEHNQRIARGETVGVPGSRPTAGAVSGDYGLIGGEQVISRGDANPAFAVAKANNNMARVEDLAKLKATDEMVAAYAAKRDAATGKLREAAFSNAKGPVDYGRVEGLVVALRNSSAGGKQETARALDTLRDWIKARKAEGRNSPEDAYALHQDINDLIRGRVNDDKGAVRLSAGFATAVKKELADVIEEQAPGFQKYLEKYSRLSKPIERLEVLRDRLGGQDLAKVTNAMPQTTADGAAYTVSQAKLRNQKMNIEGDLREKGLSLAPRQRDVLERNLGDLNAEVFASRGGKQPGSDTYQNMASANFVNRILGESLAQSGLGKAVQGPLNLLGRPFESRINDMIVDAYLDPKKMEALLRKARTQRGSPTLAGIRDAAGLQSGYGLLGSVLAQ